jgi:hypothetical protein
MRRNFVAKDDASMKIRFSTACQPRKRVIPEAMDLGV